MMSQVPLVWGVMTAVVMASLGGNVMKMRKQGKYEFAYPMMVADADKGPHKDDKDYKAACHKFNCAQRGHHNALETLPLVLSMALMGAALHPVTTAVLGALWNVGTYIYGCNYLKHGPSGRYNGLGMLGRVAFFGLILLNLYVGLGLAFGLKVAAVDAFLL